MKAAVSLALVLILIVQAARVTAQEGIDAVGHPIRAAMMREAIRLAEEPADRVGEQPAAEDRPWSRARSLLPGTEVLVTTNASRRALRYVLSVDETGISVIDLSDAALPRTVESVLRKIAANHPEYFTAARHSGYVLDKNVRLNPDGVFEGDRRLADLEQIVRSIPRPGIVELRLAHASIAPSVGAGFLIGLGAGFLLGTLNDCSGCDDPGLVTLGGTIWGAGLGAAGGLVIGSIKASSPSEAGAVVYRAP